MWDCIGMRSESPALLSSSRSRNERLVPAAARHDTVSHTRDSRGKAREGHVDQWAVFAVLPPKTSKVYLRTNSTPVCETVDVDGVIDL